MSALPAHWTAATLSDVAEIGAGGAAPQGEEYFSHDGVPFVRVQDMGRMENRVWLSEAADRVNSAGVCRSRLKLLPRGAVLFTKSGMSTLLNQRAILGCDAYVVSHIGYAIPRSGIHAEWLYWYFKVTDLGALAHATTLPSLKLSTVAGLQVPIPPEREQQRIIAEIEKQFTRLDAAVVALKRARANLKRYRAAVLKATCEGRLVPTEAELARKEGRPYEPADHLLERILKERRAKWEADQFAKMRAASKAPSDDSWKRKYKEPVPPDIAQLPPPPEGWTWATVSQIGEVQLGRQRSPKNRSKDYPTKYIRAANITENGIDLRDLLDMEFKPEERERYLLHFGDIVLSEASGSPTQVGKPAIWRDELPGCCFQNTVIRMRPCYASSEYLLVAFKNCYLSSEFAKIAGGVGINHLGADKFSSVSILIPPLAEQSRIVAEVEHLISVVDAVEMQADANLRHADRLRRSILKSAFEGKLVPQEPNDEPASVLLERIRAERAMAQNNSIKRSARPRRSMRAAKAGVAR